MQKVLLVHPSDNVLVALTDLHRDEEIRINGETIHLLNNVPAKHKFLLKSLEPGEGVYMYGVLVAEALIALSRGAILSTANIRHAANSQYKKSRQSEWHPPDVSRWRQRTFNGYVRSDSRVGTMNYWLFIPTVFCENRNMDFIRDALTRELGYGTSEKYQRQTRELVSWYRNGRSLQDLDISQLLEQEDTLTANRVFPQIDGIKFLNHEGGCGCNYQDSDTLGKLLAAYADHPNVAGVTVLSLGCQHLQTSLFRKFLFDRNPAFDKPLYFFEQQQYGQQDMMLGDAIRKTFEGLMLANEVRRKPAPLSKLCVGVKCGGSDGFSGISANPAVGWAADLLISLGGSVILAEFPELCGVEQELVDRCMNQELAEKFSSLMREYQEQAKRAGSGFEKNPSPGNIRDGLITDAMKSAGAARKGGTSPITGVLDYTEPVREAGLHLLCTPGNDVEATTGKAASGATLILFTTGLGTPTGNPICPTIKISTNKTLATKMADIIDIDCGGIITGEKTIQQSGEEILEYCIQVASGLIVPKAVQRGQDDFIPWKRGVSL